MIRPVQASDIESICAIYNHYILHSTATFQEEPMSIGQMSERVHEVQESYPWLVDEEDGCVFGYTYANRWKARAAYRYSVESTVYIDQHHQGKSIGTRLYTRLIEELRSRSVHAVMGGIALPNEASIALHEKLGFEKVAHFREVGYKFNRWIDVGYWELMLG